MTCIAAVADGKRVWMGADSYAGNGYTYVLTQRPKLRKVGEFLIGGAGSIRALDAAHFFLDVTTTGSRDVVALLPGYARGLAISNGLAFVGLSRIRESAVFGGVPIADYHEQLRCGLGVVDLSSGQTIATLQFTSGIEEIFDVQLMPGARNVALGGSEPDDHIWLLPGSAR